METTVIAVLRRFLPEFLGSQPRLSRAQLRAIWAIQNCRTAALGGRSFLCQNCRRIEFAYHSCNHKACPQCGAHATESWIGRELEKRVNAPYFLVTFTLPSQLRGEFFGPRAKQFYDAFFSGVAAALSSKLTASKDFGAAQHGFTAVLHTWNQRLMFHPHIHCLVPGVGLDPQGNLIQVRRANFLVAVGQLRGAFREKMRAQLEARNWQVDPAVWRLDWGVQIEPVGNGASAVKYLGTYVARTAIGDSRIIAANQRDVTFRWRDRSDGNRQKLMTITGNEFVARYLRHVLPRGLRSIRYYGYCHPTAKAKRTRVQLLSGEVVNLGAPVKKATQEPRERCCGSCQGPMQLLTRLLPLWKTQTRGPPPEPKKADPQPARVKKATA